MTQAEIDKRIAELQAEIEQLEKQREHVCPFGLPVRKSRSDPHTILVTDTYWQRLAKVHERAYTDYIVRAINAYPAYQTLREFVEAMEESEALVALDKREYEMWCKALAAIANGDQYDG